MRERHNVVLRSAHDRLRISAPRLERCLAPLAVRVWIIDGGHAADRSRHIIENAIDHVRRNVDFCHSGRGGAP